MNKIIALAASVGVLLVSAAVAFSAPSQSAPAASAVPPERYSQYGFGGGGVYDPEIGAQWWRDWDASYNYPPGVDGLPPYKLWTVGKIDNRTDGPVFTGALTIEFIDSVFAYEAPIIASLIITDGYTGQYWEVGNEPNFWPAMHPSTYDYQYDLYYGLIKSLDPKAQVMNGGLLTDPSGLWVYWLDYWLTHHDPPVDTWDIHPYDLSLSAAGSAASLAQMRQLLCEHDRCAVPMWIGEFGWGTWSPHDPDDIAAYAADMGAWLNAHHATLGIERWFWWGVVTGPQGMGSGGLFSANPYSYETITVVGAAYLTARDAPEYTGYMPIFILPGGTPYP